MPRRDQSWRPSSSWRACPAAGSPSSGRCSSSATRATTAIAWSARRPRGRSRLWSSSARVPSAWPRVRWRRAWTLGGSCRSTTSKAHAMRSSRGCVMATWCSSRRPAASSSTGWWTTSGAIWAGRRGDDREPRAGRADRGSPPRVRADRDPDVALHPPAPRRRVRQADPPGWTGEPLRQGRDADDGRAAHRGRRHRHLLLPSAGTGRRDLRPARGLGRGRCPGRLRRLPERPDRVGDPRPAEAALAERRRVRGRVADPADLPDHRHRGPVRGPGLDRPADLRRLRSLRHRRRGQRRQHHRRARRPVGRDGRHRVRCLHADRAAERAGAAQPGPAVCADRRGAARIPLVQRPPGADLHRRFRRPLARCDARRHGPHHRTDPGPPSDRDHLRDRDRLGHPPGRLVQDVGRPAAIPDEPDPPPLRARWLGRGEDHDPLLDHRDPRRAARRHALPRVAEPAPVTGTTMTTTGPIELDGLTLDDVRAGALRGRLVTVLGLARSGLALTRFLADAGAMVTVSDRGPAGELAEAIEGLDGRSVSLALGPAIDPAVTWRDADLVATSPSITPDFPTTEPRLRAALRDLVDARAGGDVTVPALVSEADLYLRLCPAPTIGVTGTKGKTTTSSLTAAVLAADPAHPAVLGGNIGTPLVEWLPELTPEHRVVDEL